MSHEPIREILPAEELPAVLGPWTLEAAELAAADLIAAATQRRDAESIPGLTRREIPAGTAPYPLATFEIRPAQAGKLWWCAYCQRPKHHGGVLAWCEDRWVRLVGPECAKTHELGHVFTMRLNDMKIAQARQGRLTQWTLRRPSVHALANECSDLLRREDVRSLEQFREDFLREASALWNAAAPSASDVQPGVLYSDRVLANGYREVFGRLSGSAFLRERSSPLRLIGPIEKKLRTMASLIFEELSDDDQKKWERSLADCVRSLRSVENALQAGSEFATPKNIALLCKWTEERRGTGGPWVLHGRRIEGVRYFGAEPVVVILPRPVHPPFLPALNALD